jgi:hypothetical protein
MAGRGVNGGLCDGNRKPGKVRKLAPGGRGVMMKPFAVRSRPIESTSLTNLYLAVFGGFACLFPLAFYCLVLASVNRRRRPMFLTGSADFAGLLLATAGFLIVGGPLILVGLHDAWRRQSLQGSLATIRGALVESSSPWLLVWVGYFVLVVGGAAWALHRRRHVSVIYNIDPADAHELIPNTIARLGLAGAWRGDAYWFDLPERAGIRRAIVIVTVVPTLRHLTLRWQFPSGDVRRRVEAELRRALDEIEAPDNPIGGWLLTTATGIFSLLLVLLGMFVYVLWRIRG